jgi:hypothetical protein
MLRWESNAEQAFRTVENLQGTDLTKSAKRGEKHATSTLLPFSGGKHHRC